MILNNTIISIYLATGIILFLLGLLIFRENPRQRVNIVTGFLLIFAAVGPTLAAFGLMLSAGDPAVPQLRLFKEIFLVWEFFFPQLVLFSLIFPQEHRVLKSYPHLIFFLYLPQALHLLLRLSFRSPEQILGLLDPRAIFPQVGVILEPIRVFLQFFLDSTAFIYEYHEAYFALINLLYVLTAIIVMQMSYRRITSIRLRRQLRLVIWGIRISIGFYAIAFLLPKFLFLEVSSWHAYALTSVGLIIGAGTINWAVIRHQFLDVQFIIRRGFIYSVASGVLVAAYLLLYSKVKELSTAAFGGDTKLVEAFFLIIAVIAFQPLMTFFEGLVDRVLYKRIGDYRSALEKLSREVPVTLDPNQLREKVVNILSETLLVETVYLLLPDGEGDFSSPAVSGAPGRKVVLKAEQAVVTHLQKERKMLHLSDILPQITDESERINIRIMRAELLFPLYHRDELLGILTLGRKVTRTAYSHEELSTISLLANELAVALENMQLYKEKLEKQRMEEEISLAQDIQQSLLPRDLPRSPEFEVTALNVPSKEVGGDYYDFVQVADDRLGIAIGDVSGKGIPGAMLMSNLQAVFRAYALRYPSPRLVVRHVNDHLSYTTSPEKYVTFFYGVLEYKRRKFTFTNAGHNYPILCRNGDVQVIQGGDLIVGVRAGIPYHQKSLKLQPDDIILFYTDGVTEAFDTGERIFGEDKLIEILHEYRHKRVNEIRDLIYENVLNHSRTSSLLDDLTLVVLRII